MIYLIILLVIFTGSQFLFLTSVKCATQGAMVQGSLQEPLIGTSCKYSTFMPPESRNGKWAKPECAFQLIKTVVRDCGIFCDKCPVNNGITEHKIDRYKFIGYIYHDHV
jgi:hypothetical protein